jgi:hypothetical protein
LSLSSKRKTSFVTICNALTTRGTLMYIVPHLSFYRFTLCPFSPLAYQFACSDESSFPGSMIKQSDKEKKRRRARVHLGKTKDIRTTTIEMLKNNRLIFLIN